MYVYLYFHVSYTHTLRLYSGWVADWEDASCSPCYVPASTITRFDTCYAALKCKGPCFGPDKGYFIYGGILVLHRFHFSQHCSEYTTFIWMRLFPPMHTHTHTHTHMCMCKCWNTASDIRYFYERGAFGLSYELIRLFHESICTKVGGTCTQVRVTRFWGGHTMWLPWYCCEHLLQVYPRLILRLWNGQGRSCMEWYDCLNVLHIQIQLYCDTYKSDHCMSRQWSIAAYSLLGASVIAVPV